MPARFHCTRRLIVFIAAAASIAFIFSSSASTFTARSLSQSDVQSAVNTAGFGDTVLVPAGSSAWSTTLRIGKPLTLLGNNSVLTTQDTMRNGFIEITGFTANMLVRVSGFTFRMLNFITDCAIYVHDMKGDTAGGEIRIDHNVFHFGNVPVRFDHLKGLIDNDTFYNANSAVGFSSGSRANADLSWESLDAGTAQALFVEDNTFIADSNYHANFTNEQIGTYNGGKLVVRRNTFNGDGLRDGLIFYPFMAHGSADGGCGTPSIGYWEYDAATTKCRRRGQSVIEFYDNTVQGKRIDYLFISRGGANLVFNNTITGTVTYNPRIYLREEEYDSASGNWSPLRKAWPAEDQVHNTFIWNNTYRGHDFNDGMYGYVEAAPNADAGLLKNRDYFLHEPQANGGKETFTGKNGASNSFPTDGKTYPTLGTMTFSPNGANAYYGYKPFTYPHPLRGERASIGPRRNVLIAIETGKPIGASVIYNVKGQAVYEVQGIMTSVPRPQNLPPGIYFVRMQDGGVCSFLKRMLGK